MDRFLDFSVLSLLTSPFSLLHSFQNEYMKDDFLIKIETWHKPDMGTLENVHDLDGPTWKTVEVVPIDIADKDAVAHGVSGHTLTHLINTYM